MRSRDRYALVATAIALALAGALVGGATRWAACVAALAAIATAAAHLTSRRTASRPSLLVVLVALAFGVTALQLVPLPEAIATIVAPEKWALVTEHASALGERPPRWVVTSQDPPATLVELAKLAGYLALAWGATRIAAQRRSRPWLAAAAVGAATLVALIGLAHRVVGATRLYGVFAMPVPGLVPAPLINVNHLASLTALAVPLAIGLGLTWRGGRRMTAFGAALVLATTALLTSSRGGAVGLVAGLVVAAVVLVAQRRAGVVDDNRRAPASVTVPAVVVAACALTLFGVVAARDVAVELHDTRLEELSEPTSKYQVWSAAAPMIVDNHWLGVGHGAFEDAFARRAAVGGVTYSHAENTYLQAAIDWGVPGAVALLLALAALARAAIARWRHGPLEAGALGALAAVAIHDLADFSLEMPVVAMTTIAVAALLAPARLGVDDARAPVPRRLVGARGALLAAAALAVALAASPLARSGRVERAALPPASASTALAASTRVLRRHPADGLAAGHVAAAMFARQDPRAGRLIGRALYLRPRHGGLHLLAARILARSQRAGQAAVEYARAIELARDVGPLIDEVLARLPGVDDDGVPEAARAMPSDRRQIGRVGSALMMRGRHDVAYAYAKGVARLDPARYEAQFILALAARALGRHGDALAAADAAHRLKPGPMTALARAQALAALGRGPEAIAQLNDAPPPETPSQRVQLAAALAGLQRAAGDLAGARETLAVAAARLGDTPTFEAQIRRSLASVEDALGHANQATWERRRADELDPPKDSGGVRDP